MHTVKLWYCYTFFITDGAKEKWKSTSTKKCTSTIIGNKMYRLPTDVLNIMLLSGDTCLRNWYKFWGNTKSCVLYIHLTVQTQIVSRDITVLSIAKDLVEKIVTQYFEYRNSLQYHIRMSLNKNDLLLTHICSTQSQHFRQFLDSFVFWQISMYCSSGMGI